MREGYSENLCDGVQTAGTDAVRPLLVFLDLLESYAGSGRKRIL